MGHHVGMDGSHAYPDDIGSGPTETTRTILVVDDSRAHRALLSKTLQRWGYDTEEAATGEEALAICETRHFPIIISDWMMPGMTGAEFCRAFRDMEYTQSAYFILLTAQTEREVLVEGLESGADDFLSKPFNAVELKARIRAGSRIVKAQEAVQRKNAELTSKIDELRQAHARIDRDLRQARVFQQSLVPAESVTFDGICLDFLYTPSGHVGGDLVGFFKVSETRFGVYSADVSGHGVASALMTARLAAHLSMSSPEQNVALVREGEGYTMQPPKDVCDILNRLILGDDDTDLYLTLTLADVDLAAGTVRLAQAGHPSALMIRSDGSTEFVSSFGMPIGLVPGAEFSEFAVEFSKGDRLFLYSDGVTECPDPSGELFEENRLQAFFAGGGTLQGLENTLLAFAENDSLPDDLSAVMISAR